MKRILVIGSPGSGKSTFSETLSKKSGIELIHLDNINWQSDSSYLNKIDFDNELDKILRRESWIIDGNYNRTMTTRMLCATTVIWLRIPRSICLYRIIKRYMKSKEPLNNHGNPNQLTLNFLKFVWRFPKESEPKITQLKKEFQHNILFYTLNSKKEMKQFLNDSICYQRKEDKNDRN